MPNPNMPNRPGLYEAAQRGKPTNLTPPQAPSQGMETFGPATVKNISPAAMPGVQQRNAQLRGQEEASYKTQARLGGAAGRVNTPAQGKRNMQPPTAPSMHPVVAQNKRQFVSKVKAALSRRKR